MRQTVIAILCVVLCALLHSSCSFRPEKTQSAGEPGPSAAPPAEVGPTAPDVELYLRNMTTEEKVGQLFFARPDALDPVQSLENSGVREMTPALGNMLVRYPVGGVVIFGKNIDSPRQLETFIGDLQRASKTPLMIAVDEEGGEVSRLAERPDFSLPRYESAMSVGREGREAAELMGRTIGRYLRRYGFTMDFAPVADVATNPENPVIGRRAFSADAEEAAILAGAMAKGLRAEGIVPVYKHFPGHGDTAEDSHTALAVTQRTREELRGCEWLPYEQNDLTGCGVMVGHIALPAVTGDMTPASLSPAAVDEILRRELGFDGLVITDSLAMGGVLEGRTNEETALAALRAGCDVLLMPADLPGAYRAVLAAVNSGEISAERLDESVRRILVCKAEAGLLG